MSPVPLRLRARPDAALHPIHIVGTVLETETSRVRVETDIGVLEVRRAASCLLVPQSGDSVLVSGASRSEGWIIAVLESSGSQGQRLQLSGDTSIEVDGELRISSSSHLEFRTPKTASLGCAQLEMQASKARIVFGELSAIGRAWKGTIGQLTLVGEALDSIVQRFSQHARHSLRTVEHCDEVRSGEMNYVAQGNVRLHGQNTIATARELVKLDGSQIHVG